MKLYEISDQFKTLAEIDDLPQEAINDTLEAIESEFNDKAVAVRHVLVNFDAAIKAIDDEIKRLSDMKKAATNKQDALKEYLILNMEASGIKKIDHPTFKITLRKPSEIVVIDDENQLPDDYVKVKTTVSPDKTKIKAALKKGDSVAGASLALGKSSILIK